MTFDEYQNLASQTVSESVEGDGIYFVLGLCSEAGEVADKIKKTLRDGGEIPRKGLAKELGDCLWYLAMLADTLDVDLSTVAKINLDKLQSRQDRNKIGGSGDDR